MTTSINPWRGATGPKVAPAEPPKVDWTDPDAVWVYKRYLFDATQIEVKPNTFVSYEPHKGQKPVHFPAKGEEWEVFVAAAGQRAGKSLTAAMELVAGLGMPGQRFWIVAPTYDLTRRVYEMVYDIVVTQQIHGKGSVEKASLPTSKDSLTIKMKWGSWVTTKSAEQPNSLVGEKLTGVVLDEAAQVGEEIWTDYLEPRLVNLEGWALLISSPRGRNWFWKYHRRGTEEKYRARGWRAGHFKTEDNPYVNTEKLREKKAVLPKLTYQQEYEGLFVSKVGLVYDDYRDELMPAGHLFDPEKNPIDPNWTHFLGNDVGLIHPTAAVWGAVDPYNNLWIYEEYLKSGESHQDHAQAIATMMRYPLTTGWQCRGGSRTLKLRPEDAGINVRDIYAEAGLHFYAANDAVTDGISLVQKYLKSALAAPRATTHPRIYISKECLNLRVGLLDYRRQGRRGSQHEDTKSDLPEKPRKYKDDIVDALRYLVAGKPTYQQPVHYTEHEDYDASHEGRRVGASSGGYMRPGVDYA